MSKKSIPFIYDMVGSFLRPAALKQAREDFKAGKITREALTQVENEAQIEPFPSIRKASRKGKIRRLSRHHRRRISPQLLASGLYVGT